MIGNRQQKVVTTQTKEPGEEAGTGKLNSPNRAINEHIGA